MRLGQMFRRGRATAAVVAGTVMVVGGSGAGAAALVLGHGAGALSLQAPALAVKEQNVNSAGRIRVALPAGGPTPPEGPRLVAYQPFDGYRVELVGQLAEPLGQRVVVDLDGSPVVVEHAGGPQRR